MPLTLSQKAIIVGSPQFKQIIDVAMVQQAASILLSPEPQSDISKKMAKIIRANRNVYTTQLAASMGASLERIAPNFNFADDADFAQKLRTGDLDSAILTYLQANWERLSKEFLEDNAT